MPSSSPSTASLSLAYVCIRIRVAALLVFPLLVVCIRIEIACAPVSLCMQAWRNSAEDTADWEGRVELVSQFLRLLPSLRVVVTAPTVSSVLTAIENGVAAFRDSLRTNHHMTLQVTATMRRRRGMVA